MHKSEFLALSIATVVAGFAFYHYEENLSRHAFELNSQGMAHSVGPSPDFSKIDNITEKKRSFFAYLKPGIALENKRVKQERARLEQIEQSFKSNSLTSDDAQYAQRLSYLYNVPLTEQGITPKWLDTMLHRVDVLPEGLVLVQAANESAWGTSRFATQANNYFGQWCYRPGCGLIPAKRQEGATHEVAKFSSVQQSIHGYFMNVNRNKAYFDLREIRYQRHLKGQSLIDTEAAMALTNGLLKYSSRGEAYVNDLQSMIRHNKQFWEQTPQLNVTR